MGVDAPLVGDVKPNQETAKVEAKAYKVFHYECECPHCQETVRVADDEGVSGASFDQECTGCGKSFSTRCE